MPPVARTESPNHDPAETVLAYHRRTTHRPEAYARGPEAFDWEAQPDPWRSWPGCPRTVLPLVSDRIATRFGALCGGTLPLAAPLSLAAVAGLLELAFGLSAWKQNGPDSWALRCNPSSGNLHPTEAYVLATGIPGLSDGLWHYDSRDHALGQRCATRFAGGQLWIGLSSVVWREAWKYGERAFRYCQLDIGHALGALEAAAATLGWRIAPLTGPDAAGLNHAGLDHGGLARLLGTDRDADFAGVEGEEAEVLVAILPAQGADTAASLPIPAAGALWSGSASRLDPHPMRDWPVLAEVATASRGEVPPVLPLHGTIAPMLAPGEAKAAAVILGRRSAQRYDRGFAMPAAGFARLLEACRPSAAGDLELLAFVHAVDGLERGLYALPRSDASRAALREGLDPAFAWEHVSSLPGSAPLYRLLSADCRKLVRALACDQAIAADGCVTFCLLANFAATLRASPAAYRGIHWQAGMLGQRLYLDATAAGLAGTGIGCFLDEELHRLLGLGSERWRALYHFAIGLARQDPRIVDAPAYAPRQRSEAPVWV